MSDPKLAHLTIAGNPSEAIKFGLTIMAKCGLRFVPTTTATLGIPSCPECHSTTPHRLPDRPHFVYRCYDRTGRLVYVGSSVAPRQRMEQHRLSSWWFEQVDRITYTVFPNKDYTLYKEREAIGEENPRWNIKGRNFDDFDVADYRDVYTALTFNKASEKRLDTLRAKARLRFGVDIADLESEVAS